MIDCSMLYGTWPHQCKPIHHRTFCGSKSFQLREGLFVFRGAHDPGTSTMACTMGADAAVVVA